MAENPRMPARRQGEMELVLTVALEPTRLVKATTGRLNTDLLQPNNVQCQCIVHI